MTALNDILFERVLSIILNAHKRSVSNIRNALFGLYRRERPHSCEAAHGVQFGVNLCLQTRHCSITITLLISRSLLAYRFTLSLERLLFRHLCTSDHWV
uniref:AlNc14C1459G12949 protein n=1 Tax=Albugo laibachii Nc14 TaxID=890382 RepID=F0X2Q1_9STRA|nr:AlNc14C1459G12949 [Albugo laibachii Nc14]|eukprot:CCA28183.1 AlNc14C1459G12949 [Albugo laibachii Nc14]